MYVFCGLSVRSEVKSLYKYLAKVFLSLFDSWLLSVKKLSRFKALLVVTLVSLTLRASTSASNL